MLRQKIRGCQSHSWHSCPLPGYHHSLANPWRGDLQEAVTRDSALSSLSLPATDLSLSSSVGSWTSVMHQSLSRRRTENSAPMPVLKQQGEPQTSHQCTGIFRAWQCNTRTHLPGRCLQVSEEMHLAEDGEIEQCL